MPPQEDVSPEFNWNDDFNDAHTELESASPGAASVLAKALNSARRMADMCQLAIARNKDWHPDSPILTGWLDFLERLSNDADSFYPMYLSLLPRGEGVDLQTLFAGIAATALDAMIRISETAKPTLEARKKTVVGLRALMKDLQTAEETLAPSPAREVTGLPAPGRGEESEIPAPEAALVPLVGRIAAGTPNLAEEEVEDIFPLPRQVVGEGELYLLRVSGQSMTGAGIVEGDWVVIRQQPDVENGEIVVAMIDDEATVKKFRHVDGEVSLLAQNSSYEDIPVEGARIVGKVVAVVRRM